MAKQSQPKMVTLSFAILLLLIGIIAGILGGYYVSVKQANKYPSYQYKKVMKEKQQCDALTIVSPTKGQTVTNPLTVTAIVENANKKCHWTVFEAQAASMELKNASGQVIGTGLLTTNDEWMTDQAVTYTGEISFDTAQATPKLWLVLNEEDPAGLGGQQVTLPLSY